MDAHVTVHLPVEEESLAPSVRHPGVTDELPTDEGLQEEGASAPARLPGEAEEPPLGKHFEEWSGAAAPNAGEQLPAAAPWRKRRQTQLLGAAVVALGAAGASAFLVSSYDHLSPVPQVASTVRHGRPK